MHIIRWCTSWKYRYFRKKMQGVEKMIEDLLFKRFKTQEIREDIRKEYDNMRSRLASLEEQIKNQKQHPSMEKGEIARLDDQKVLFDRDIERFKEQMRSLDLEILGSKKTAEFPDGIQGVNQQIDALRELKEMIKQYLHTL